MLTISELMHTDLPEPVEPAIRVCGILARSAMVTLPAMSRPRRPPAGFWLLELGGVDDLPDRDGADHLVGHLDADGGLVGDGGLDAHAEAARFKAMSSARLVILLILTPADGCSS